MDNPNSCRWIQNPAGTCPVWHLGCGQYNSHCAVPLEKLESYPKSEMVFHEQGSLCGAGLGAGEKRVMVDANSQRVYLPDAGYAHGHRSVPASHLSADVRIRKKRVILHTKARVYSLLQSRLDSEISGSPFLLHFLVESGGVSSKEGYQSDS